MAKDKDDIPKGAADNLQKAAQALAKVAESMEKVFADINIDYTYLSFGENAF